VLIEMLERAGLKESDYKLERAGGVLQRFQALMGEEARRHAAALAVRGPAEAKISLVFLFFSFFFFFP